MLVLRSYFYSRRVFSFFYCRTRRLNDDNAFYERIFSVRLSSSIIYKFYQWLNRVSFIVTLSIKTKLLPKISYRVVSGTKLDKTTDFPTRQFLTVFLSINSRIVSFETILGDQNHKKTIIKSYMNYRSVIW